MFKLFHESSCTIFLSLLKLHFKSIFHRKRKDDEKILFRNNTENLFFSGKIFLFSLSFYSKYLFFLEEIFFSSSTSETAEKTHDTQHFSSSREKLEKKFFLFLFRQFFSSHNNIIQKTHPTRVLIHGDEVDE